LKTKDFISKFNDVEVIQKMQSIKTPEEAYAVAKEYGVTDSLEEFVEEMTKFKTAIDELSEEDLEAVAGGLSPASAATVAFTIGSAISGAAIVSAVASASAASVGITLGVSVGTAVGAAATAAV